MEKYQAIAKGILYLSLRFSRVSCGKLSDFCGKRTVFVEKTLKNLSKQMPPTGENHNGGDRRKF
ncbi:hypothetical protein [Picosynechococcus sp. PCC 8807]|uniref:hypothetical protein n=1 Tax=Picosynechococcus sp. PCC 8807 TaxID=195248 RepID=UPI0012EE61ED|nr:hypothetical protein [Picosynechococcus sp. PCC 8807]